MKGCKALFRTSIPFRSFSPPQKIFVRVGGICRSEEKSDEEFVFSMFFAYLCTVRFAETGRREVQENGEEIIQAGVAQG